MRHYEINPFSQIVKQFTQSGEEPPQKDINRFKRTYSELFEDIGYVRDGVEDFDRILNFMAHWQSAIEQRTFINRNRYTGLVTDDVPYCNPKGLLLYGACGTGKTLAARIIAKRFGFYFIDTHKIGTEYLTKDGHDWLAKWLSEYRQQPIVIDDLGAEGEIKKFGNESPMRAIITQRASYWEIYGTPTIYTTNASTPADLIAHYGSDPRILDRLTAYYDKVKFTGASLRK
jgi:DNA replication protein DnaC